MFPTIRNISAFLLAVVVFLALIGYSRFTPGAPKLQYEVVGTIRVLLPAGTIPKGVDMPDAKITLLDGTNTEVGHAKTELDGHFRVKAPKAGSYSLCWDIQGRAGCRREVVLKDPTTYLGFIRVSLKEPLLYGRVLTADQRACWMHDPFFRLDVSTNVSVSDSGGQAAAPDVRANVLGDYLFILKTPDTYTVTAQCEKTKERTAAVVRTGAVRANMTLKNTAPFITELAARSAGKGVVRVEPNTPLELVANSIDREGDAVEYLWRDDDGVIPTPAANPNQIVRNAPKEPGRRVTYLMARDGRGGFTYKRFVLEVAKLDIQFAGTVIDEVTRAPVANAQVELGGATVNTNATGYFNITGPTNPDARYVLNIRHPNYALLSQVSDRSIRGNVFELIRAQIKVVPVAGGITLVDTESSGWCGGRGDVKPGQTEPTKGVVTHAMASQVTVKPVLPVEYVDPIPSKNYKPLDPEYFRRLTTKPDCKQAGAQIIIPAGALVDSRGNKATGNVRTAIASRNPTRRALPGDYRAIDSASLESELLSYGAVYAEFRDSSGNLLNLAPGTTAEVQVPIPAQQLSTAKPKIDFWSYDEKTGKWRFESQAVLKNTPNGPAYVAKTTHFSDLNMDVAGNDPAVATCLRFEVDTSLSAWTNKSIRATVSYNGNQVQTKETSLDGDQYHAIFRIPFGTAFPPNTLRLELSGTYNGQSVVLVDNVINTDLRPKMTGNDLWPDYPFAECGDPVLLAAPAGIVPQYSSNDATNRPFFLTGPFGDFLPDDGEQVATDYYAAIGATANKPTLGDWWSANGFDATTGDGGTRASYMNFNDLGFGRDMHCNKTGNNVACYVTNYGAPNQLAANADSAANQVVAQRGATVAMEFTDGQGAEAVQFYVYSNEGPTSGLLKFADLDGFGPKPVPHLCLVCHGGSSTLTNNKAQNSRFREFDLPSFHYPNDVTWDYGQGVPAEVEAADLGTLNSFVHDLSPSNTPIRNLIAAWYPGANYAIAPGLPTPPAGWNGSAANIDGYHSVYGTTCRTCHVARDDGAASPPYITFNSKANFEGTNFVVCGLDYRVMPNAIITFKNFWTDTPRVNKYEALMNPAVPINTCQNDVQ